MNKEIAIKNLNDLEEILSGFNIQMFLAYGTCLGVVREGDIIDHDLDTDVGILAEKWNFDVIPALYKAGFRILNIFGMFNYGCEIAVARDGVKTDIMFFYKKRGADCKEYYWNALWKNGCRNGQADMIKHTYPVELLEVLKDVKLGGYHFGVPERTEDYLIRVYGADWRIPVKDWNWQTDHKCIEQ